MPSGSAAGSVNQPGAARPTFRPDIQGLRMIAVTAVILDHLIHWPSGGFVGVDVFFVISGFLITGLLLREHERTGTISFVGFYRRRIKRIIPAAMVVIASTVIAAFFLFNQSRAQQTIWDGIWATLFGANWRFAIADTDYFQAGGAVSPLQHYWSLSVEEQFYFIWPWIMLGIFALLGAINATRHARRVVFAAILAITLVSFAWSVWETGTNPGWAYFSTFSRAWELGVGAIIAVSAGLFTRLPQWLRPLLGWVGLAGICASAFLISSASAFPAPAAALPVISTALVIIGGTGGQQKFLWPIMNPVSSYIGSISYSLYLWHFPVIIFLAPLLEGRRYIVVSLVIMVVLSVLSYHFVENPIRSSRWLEPRRKPSAGSRVAPRLAFSLMGILAVAVIAVGTITFLPRPAPASSDATGTTPPASTGTDTAEERLQLELRSALSATEWPEFDPPIENLADQRVPQWTENYCINVTRSNRDRCVWGPEGGAGTIAVVGDSIATSWLPAIIGAFPDYQVHSFSLNACPFPFASVKQRTSDPGVYEECDAHHTWVTSELTALKPDVIIVADSYHTLNRLTSGAYGAKAVAEWKVGFAAAAAALPDAATKVVLFSPPGGADLQECFTPISSPADCIGSPERSWEDLRTAESEAADLAGMTFVPTEQWFCIKERCPSFVGRAAMYADSGHLTATSSSHLTDVVREALTPLIRP